MRDRILKAIQAIATVVAVPAIISTLALNLWFYRIGSLALDQATGRTYPVQEHGTLYVTPFLGQLSIALFFVGFGAIVLAVAVGLWRQNSN